jgi:hypothetical protein
VRELTFWRGCSAALALGWTATVAAWPGEEPSRGSEGVERARLAPVASSVAVARPEPGGPRSAEGVARAEAVVTPEALAAAKAELRAQLSAHHQARSGERLDHALEVVAAFAVDHELGDDVRTALEDAVLAMHERMSASPPPPPFDDATEEERSAAHDRVRASVERLDGDLSAALGGDEELVDELREELRPPGPPR